jgi:hypothetical protein
MDYRVYSRPRTSDAIMDFFGSAYDKVLEKFFTPAIACVFN